jgi:adenylate cyclase
MNSTEELLLEREIKGLKFITFFRIYFVLSTIGITFIVGKSYYEKIAVAIFCFIVFLGALCYYYLLSKRRFIKFIGISGCVIDIALLFALPFIWYNSVGGEIISRAYLIKSPTIVTISFILLIIHSFSIQPLYPVIISIGVIFQQIFLYYYIKQDARVYFNNDFVGHFLSDNVNPEIIIGFVFSIVLISFALSFFTYKSRKLIFEAIHLELQKSNLSRYFSPNVFDTVSSNASNIGITSRKQNVAILFSDIRGFTELSENLSAEEVVSFLNEYHSKMVSIIFKHGGTLDKFMGDGIMVSFGTPFEKEDDPLRAVNSAIEMREALKELNQFRLSQNKKPIRQGIGIHFGEAIVGNIGTKERLEYTVIGDTVNTASRIESKCKELSKDILVSADIANLLSNQINFISLGFHDIRGKKEKLEIFELQDI